LIDDVLLAEDHLSDRLPRGLETAAQLFNLLGKTVIGVRVAADGGGIALAGGRTGRGLGRRIGRQEDASIAGNTWSSLGALESMSTNRDLRERIGPYAPADEGGAGAGARAAGESDLFQGVGAGEFVIDRDGTWWHDGKPIPRRDLVKLFATVLRREEDDGFALVTPAERARVHVRDAPFLAEELDVRTEAGQQVVSLRSNVDQWVDAGPDHPIRVQQAPDSDAPRPYILMKPGLEARIVRSVFYQLAELAEPGTHNGQEVLGIWSRGTFFPLDPTATA
jgi:hypothetical protein